MKTFISTILLLLSINISAQEDALGVSLNVGTSKVINSNDEYLGIENNIGLAGNAGVYYTHYFNDKSLIVVDVLFSVLSSNRSYQVYLFDENGFSLSSTDGEEVKLQNRNYYISVPIKYGFEHKNFVYTFGGYAAINLSNYLTSDGVWNLGEKTTVELEKYDKLDFGLTIGIEKILNNGMILGLNYSHGLAILKYDGDFPSGSVLPEIKNRQLTFGIKYEFYRRMY
jgi:hypothetical protein